LSHRSSVTSAEAQPMPVAVGFRTRIFINLYEFGTTRAY
jgi:hypothetical protein